MTTDAIDLYVYELPGDDGEPSLQLNCEIRSDDDNAEPVLIGLPVTIDADTGDYLIRLTPEQFEALPFEDDLCSVGDDEDEETTI
jgi:hypothetical protein